MAHKAAIVFIFRDLHQMSLLFLREVRRINQAALTLKSSENLWFSDYFRRNRNELICLNLLRIKGEVWRLSLSSILFYRMSYALNFNMYILKNAQLKVSIASFLRNIKAVFSEAVTPKVYHKYLFAKVFPRKHQR